MDNTIFAPVNFDTIEEGYICDSGQYEGMTNSEVNIRSIMLKKSITSIIC